MSISNLFSENDFLLKCAAIQTSGGASNFFNTPVVVLGSATSDTTLSMECMDMLHSCRIFMGDGLGGWNIQRTGNNQQFAIFPTGNSDGASIVMLVNNGKFVIIGAGGMECQGPIDCKTTFLDNLGSSGLNGQYLMATGTGVQWTPVDKQIFMNSRLNVIAADTFISQTDLSASPSVTTYMLATNTNFTKILVNIDIAPGAGSWDFVLQKNGVDTALVVTLTGASLSGDVIGSISYIAGDTYNFRIGKIGLPPAINNCMITLIYN